MSDTKSALSFDAIIQADRQRKKNEALANQIFGRKQQHTGNNSRGETRASTRTPDLASRITKRSSSVTSTGSPRRNPFTSISRPSSTNPQNARSSRLASALDSPQVNVVPAQRRGKSQGLSIKGKAGPFTVEASNFAPGTTAADIESALHGETLDDDGVSAMLSCRIVSTNPTVVAELVFTERVIADKIISTYDNQKADGRLLHLFLKQHGSVSAPAARPKQADLVSAPGPAASLAHAQPVDDSAMEDVDEAPPPQDDRERWSREAPKAEASVPDARQGSNGQQTSNAHHDAGGGSGSGRRDDDRRDGERDRDRERERERDRDRDRDHERERERYDRRDDRGAGSYHRNDRPEAYNSRSSHYGNGVGNAPGRGTFGGPSPFPRGGGRMYTDDMSRGGRRGGFGGPFGTGFPGAAGGGYRRGY